MTGKNKKGIFFFLKRTGQTPPPPVTSARLSGTNCLCIPDSNFLILIFNSKLEHSHNLWGSQNGDLKVKNGSIVLARKLKSCAIIENRHFIVSNLLLGQQNPAWPVQTQSRLPSLLPSLLSRKSQKSTLLRAAVYPTCRQQREHGRGFLSLAKRSVVEWVKNSLYYSNGKHI